MVTLVLWVGCLLVGVLGLTAGRTQVRANPANSAPVEVRVVNVDLAAPAPPIPAPEGSESPAAKESETTPAAGAMREAAVPALPAVALPGPAIAFAVPVEGPVRIVATQAAVPVARVPAAANSGDAAGTGSVAVGRRAAATATPVAVPVPPPVTRLIVGEGEGDQPRPEYPREAVLGRQEGTVVVRFGVGADGRVSWAQAIDRCPWPLLNQSALRTIRETWRFPAGLPRVYEVPIQFQLHAHDSGGPR
jgi:protein TonB